MSSGPVIIDASVAVCLLLGEPEQDSVARALHEWTTTKRPRVVPVQFWLEVVNRLSREVGMTGAGILGAVHRLDTFGLETVEVDRTLVLRVIDLVERFRLTAYDAQYLAIAESLDGELATLDRALTVAAGDRAVRLVDDRRLHERPAVYEAEVTWPMYKEASAYLAKLRADALRG
jgi:predicted nucleic acid-binding protein